MNLRYFLITLFVLLAGLTTGYFISRGANDFLEITHHEKDLSELTRVPQIADSVDIELPLRIVDPGGAGVLPDTAEWIRETFGADSLLVANMTGFLNASYEVMRSGLYISEWDILGASSAVFSNIYYITRDHFQEVIDEGFNAVKGAISLKDMLLEVRSRVTENVEDYDRLIASVEYEIELFRLLDYYRQFFMNYYRWIDTGDPRAKTAYKVAMGQCKAVMNYHGEKYGGDLSTLGMDFDEAATGIEVAEQTPSSVRWARVTVFVAIFLLIMGIPGFIRDRAHQKFAGSLYFDALFRPYLVSRLNAYHSTGRLAVFLVILYLLALVIFSSFSSLLFPLSMGLLSLTFALILAIFMNKGRDFTKILVTIMAPKMIIISFILVIVAIRGPMYFWYQIWLSDLFKIIFLSVFIMLLFRKFQIYVIMGRKWSHRNMTGAAALVFMVFGVQLLLAGLALQLFGLEESLTALNNDLLVLPRGLSKIMGITTHLGIPLKLPLWIIYFASAVTGFSFLLFLFNRKADI
ncbi:MAG: hypothetical protein KAT15_31685 [Bacteroidales bacterium]|nr:hypothetical protein [Bacteroidales bacterium]